MKRAEREQLRTEAHKNRLGRMKEAFTEAKFQLEVMPLMKYSPSFICLTLFFFISVRRFSRDASLKLRKSTVLLSTLMISTVTLMEDIRRSPLSTFPVCFSHRSGCLFLQIDWSSRPQPIKLRIRCMRAVKDKLPKGNYVLLVSVWDRLGGNRISWNAAQPPVSGSTTCTLHREHNPNCESCLGEVAATKVVSHDGNWTTLEMAFHQTLTTVCPSKPDMRPYMVFLFELVHLRGEHCPYNRVVAWGAFPICDPTFHVVKVYQPCPISSVQYSLMHNV